jgi:hypothetical protein
MKEVRVRRGYKRWRSLSLENDNFDLLFLFFSLSETFGSCVDFVTHQW